MIYIKSYVTLSKLNSFEKGILPELMQNHSKELIEPDYKALIPSNALRRMSKVIKMGVACGVKVSSGFHPKSIVVGTGLGCFSNSIEFTKEYIFRNEGLLSPGAFIQSTDNTIAGQLGQILKVEGYNITHTNKGTSFESALIDSMLLSEESNDDILVGATDELIEMFSFTNKDLHGHQLGEGSSFFIVSGQEKNSLAKISLVEIVSLEEPINEFVARISAETNADFVLYGNSFVNKEMNCTFVKTPGIDYSSHSGIYFTNSSFALQLAVEMLNSGFEEYSTFKRILIVNNFNDHDMGLILVEK